MVSVSKKITVSCLDCERTFELSFQPVEGQIITCPNCDAELEVINVQPLELDFYYEDWDEDDEDWDGDEDWDNDEDWEDDSWDDEA
jgi:alpha-aminoadipate carrier protein LysW